MKHSISFLIICLTLISFCNGQDTTYFDTNWIAVDKNAASFYRVISQLDTCWRIEDYFIDGSLQMQGHLSSPKHTDRHGNFEWYDKDGWLQETGSYRNGKKHGVLKWYYAGGAVKSLETYNNGLSDGPSESYHPNGKLHVKGQASSGELHGSFEYWHDNGERKAIGQFYNGKQDGEWVFYDTIGAIIDEVLFTAFLEMEECKLSFEIPTDKWYYSGIQSNTKYIWHEFKRKPFTNPEGQSIVPNISFISQEVPDDLDVVNFSLTKRSSAGFEVDSVFNYEDSTMKLKNAIGYIGKTVYENGVEHTVYVIHAIHNQRGIQIIMDMTSDIFPQIGGEFDTAIGRIIPIE